MDLYKWCYKLGPLVESELLIDCLELAAEPGRSTCGPARTTRRLRLRADRRRNACRSGRLRARTTGHRHARRRRCGPRSPPVCDELLRQPDRRWRLALLPAGKLVPTAVRQAAPCSRGRNKMTDRVTVGNLRVAQTLYDFVNNEALPGTDIDPDTFWSGVDKVVADLTPKNQDLLARRDDLQAQIDKWHRHRVIEPLDPQAYKQFLTEIGYLQPEPDPSRSPPPVSTTRSPPRQVRSWWCPCSMRGSRSTPPTRAGVRCTTRCTAPTSSPRADGAEKASGYNRVRGDKVIAYAREFLDKAVPLASGSWADATGLSVEDGRLQWPSPTGRSGWPARRSSSATPASSAPPTGLCCWSTTACTSRS